MDQNEDLDSHIKSTIIVPLPLILEQISQIENEKNKQIKEIFEQLRLENEEKEALKSVI